MSSLFKRSLSKHFILASLILVLASVASAQSTTVSGQVTDSAGQAWNNGTYAFQFVPNNQYPFSNYSWTGGALNQNAAISGSLNSVGGYSQAVPSNTAITPSGSQWRLQVCSGTVPVNCFTVTQSITGGSQTVNVTPPPIVVPPGAGNTAYNTNEVSPAVVGSQIYIIGSGLQLCSVVTAGSCTTWSGSSSSSNPTAATVLAWNPLYGTKGTGKWVPDATFTNASTTVTTPVTDRPFLCPGSVYPCSTSGVGSDVGDIVWGSNAQVEGTTQLVITQIIPEGTIVTVNSAHSVTVSAAALFGCTPVASDNCTFVWGPDDDTVALQKAFDAAVVACGNLILPAGGMIVGSPINASANTLCNPQLSNNDTPTSIGVIGQGGYGSMLLVRPSMAGTNCNPACFFSISGGLQRRVYRDFAIASFSSAPASAAGKNGIAVSYNSDVKGLWFLDWWPSNANNFTAISATPNGNDVTNVHENFLINSGFTGLFSGGDGINVYNNWIQGQVVGWSIQAATLFPAHSWGNTISLVANQAVNMLGNAGLRSRNDTFSKNGNNTLATITTTSGANVVLTDTSVSSGSASSGTALSCVTGATCTVNGGTSSIFSSGTTSTGINNAGTLTLLNTFVSGTLNSINNSGKVIDQGGVSVTGAIANTGTWFGSASITGTAFTTSSFALTSGWGTSTKASAAGDSQSFNFVITGAVGTASPVVTVTFPTPYFVPPSQCTITQTSGTFAVLTNPAISTPTITGFTITWAGTPAANTYGFSGFCK